MALTSHAMHLLSMQGIHICNAAFSLQKQVRGISPKSAWSLGSHVDKIEAESCRLTRG